MFYFGLTVSINLISAKAAGLGENVQIDPVCANLPSTKQQTR